jgi:hypothetical protein
LINPKFFFITLRLQVQFPDLDKRKSVMSTDL